MPQLRVSGLQLKGLLVSVRRWGCDGWGSEEVNSQGRYKLMSCFTCLMQCWLRRLCQGGEGGRTTAGPHLHFHIFKCVFVKMLCKSVAERCCGGPLCGAARFHVCLTCRMEVCWQNIFTSGSVSWNYRLSTQAADSLIFVPPDLKLSAKIKVFFWKQHLAEQPLIAFFEEQLGVR